MRIAASGLALLVARTAFAAEPEAIGPYVVERNDAALVVRAGEGDRAALWLVAGGLALAALGALRARRRMPWLLLGAGLAAVGGVARVEGGAVWRATPDGVTEQRRFRAERSLARAEIEALEIGSRRATGVDVKAASPPRRVELRVVARGVGAPIGFAFEREDDARRLGALLAETLGVPLR